MVLFLKNTQVKQVYSKLIQEAEAFPQYNFRKYFLRKINEDFEAKGASLPDSELPNFLKEKEASLQQMKRMVSVANLYSKEKLVIEKRPEERSSE